MSPPCKKGADRPVCGLVRNDRGKYIPPTQKAAPVEQLFG